MVELLRESLIAPPIKSGLFRLIYRLFSPRQRGLVVTRVANLKFASLGSSVTSEFRIRSHTSNSLNLVWFMDLKLLNANAMQMTGTANPPHDCDGGRFSRLSCAIPLCVLAACW